MTSSAEKPSSELQAARRDLVDRAGGTCDTTTAAELLGLTPEDVRKRIHQDTLLAFRSSSEEPRLPCAQFTEDGVVEGLEEVLAAMHVEDPWMRIQLFLDDDVLGALQEGRVEDAVRAVNSYLPRDGREG